MDAENDDGLRHAVAGVARDVRDDGRAVRGQDELRGEIAEEGDGTTNRSWPSRPS